MKKLNLKMQGIGEMLSKEQMKNVTGGYGCPTQLGQPCDAYYPGISWLEGGICANSPSGRCECQIGLQFFTPVYGCSS